MDVIPHESDAADVAGLKSLLEERRSWAERTLGRAVDVRGCYEAGHEGFWLPRWLERAMGLEKVALAPASPLVSREAKQRKTNRIDTTKLIRALPTPGLRQVSADALVRSRLGA